MYMLRPIINNWKLPTGFKASQAQFGTQCATESKSLSQAKRVLVLVASLHVTSAAMYVRSVSARRNMLEGVSCPAAWHQESQWWYMYVRMCSSTMMYVVQCPLSSLFGEITGNGAGYII